MIMLFITNHKNQSFLITLFLFIPILYGFIYSKNFTNIQHKNFNKNHKTNIMLCHFTHLIQTPIKNTPKKQLKQIQMNKASKTLNQSIKSKLVSTPKKTTPLQAYHSLISTNSISHKSFTSSISNDDFLKEIKQAISNTLIYPRQAQKMRMSGKVLIEFTWTNHQILKNIKIITPSKYKLLNESALETIRLASKHFPKYNQTFNIRIPIIYSIK